MDVEKRFQQWEEAKQAMAIKMERRQRRKVLIKRIMIIILCIIFIVPLAIIAAASIAIGNGFEGGVSQWLDGQERIRRRNRW